LWVSMGLLCLQPEKIKIPVQCHDGEEDAMEGLADPKVNPCCSHIALLNSVPPCCSSHLLPYTSTLHGLLLLFVGVKPACVVSS